MASIVYTQYIRRHGKKSLSVASNAAPPTYDAALTRTGSPPSHEPVAESISEVSEKRSNIDSKAKEVTPPPYSSPSIAVPETHRSIALFPQYIAQDITHLTIKEDPIPHLACSFSVFRAQELLFRVERDFTSVSQRGMIVDVRTQQPIMSVHKNLFTLPESFLFEDPSGARLLDLQGKFFVPLTGAKSKAYLLNAETGGKIELSMKVAYLKRHATVNDEAGETLVSMKSNVLQMQTVLAHRRTYDVTVRAGVDMCLAVGMIIAAHERVEQ